ncbi:MAG TPA: AbfB domain-containing protein [Actinoplanes sp.]|nr:AbfB domain-containing protein [Actinoplanes sp.]
MTVYGTPPQGTPVVVKVLVAMAAVIALAAVVMVWRIASDEASPVGTAAGRFGPTAASTPAPTGATEISAIAATASVAPTAITPGSWAVSLGDAPRRHLTINGDQAVMSAAGPTVLTVTGGLADRSCLSLRAPDGRYLRHFSFRLRFDNPDDSALFRADATFCPRGGDPAGTFKLRSANFPDLVIHRRGTQLHLGKPDGSDDFDADSSFTFAQP